MSTGRFSNGAQLSGILAVILLLTFQSGADYTDCPKHCSCSLDGYTCFNGNMYLYQFMKNALQIDCGRSEINYNCSDLPQFDHQYDIIRVGSCNTRIIPCIGDPAGLNQPFVLTLEYIVMQGTLTVDDVKNLKYLHTLKTNLGLVAPVPVDAINSLKNLRFLRLFMGNLQLSNSTFNSTSMKELYLVGTDISNTQIESYKGLPNLKKKNLTGVISNTPKELFNGLPNLKTMYLDNVDTGNISVNFLKGLISLEYLSLKTNKIKYIESGVFLSTPRLRHLNIIENPLESITDHLIEELPSLEILNINCLDNNNEFKINTRTFSRLSVLKSVTIKNCILQKLPVHSLNISDDLVTAESVNGSLMSNFSSIIFTNLTSLTFLDLSNDSIYELPDVMFTNVTAIEKLLLNNNKIKEISQIVFGNLSTLNLLDLSYNYIQVLHVGMFTNLTALKILKLDHNAIEILTLNLFKGLQSLTNLYLQNNNIMRINVDRGINGLMTPFRHLTNVRLIDLSNNKLSRIYGDLTLDMPRIETLKLAYNHFKGFWDFQDLITKRNNMTLDLSNNYISQIKLMQQKHGSSKNAGLNGGRLYLSGNPVICDCNNYALLLRSQGIGVKGDPKFILYRTRCIGPPHLKGKFITDLSPTDLVCNVIDNCPHKCNCTLRPVREEFIINCEKIPREIVNYTIGYFLINNYTLNLKTDPGSLLDLSINNLNLSDTNLTDIKFTPNKHLKLLDVSTNKLTTIPEAFLKTNITLYVSKNPLECNCALVKELKEYRVGDYKLVRCADGTELSTIDVGRLCAWRMILTGYLVMAIIVGIFLTKLAVSVYRDTKHKRMSIARVIFRRGSEYSIQMETRLEMVKEYDLFISYAHQDTQFVRKELLPKLENKYGQKVCIHDRDWVAGELIDEQIVQSVENSRRTIIILTEAFILSEWSYLEFRTAHNMSIREGRPRVIIILLDKEIVNDVRLSKAIKSYTLVNTYLVWGDPDFWIKLKRILPKHGRR